MRTTKALGYITLAVGVIAAWASAAFANDPVQAVSQVFVFSTVITGVLASISGVLLFTPRRSTAPSRERSPPSRADGWWP